METIIFVRNLVLSGIHGSHSIQTQIPRTFVFDIAVSVDSIAGALRSDQLTDTLNYHYIEICAKEVVAGHSFHLIETFAHTIAAKIFTHPKAVKIKLTLAKRELEDGEMISGITIEQSADEVRASIALD